MGEEINIVYAKGFRIVEFPGYTKINVHNPWQGAENVSFTYYLVKSEIDIPKELEKIDAILGKGKNISEYYNIESDVL